MLNRTAAASCIRRVLILGAAAALAAAPVVAGATTIARASVQHTAAGATPDDFTWDGTGGPGH